MEIRSISLVNARTPVVNCLVQNVSVDITINQVRLSSFTRTLSPLWDPWEMAMFCPVG